MATKAARRTTTLPRSPRGFSARHSSKRACCSSYDNPRRIDECDSYLWLHDYLDLRPSTSTIHEFAKLPAQNVTFVGRYDPDELPELIANVVG